ncbi:MAG: amino acid ABC transporter permease [Propionibacteriaceae bacterium]|nr:amino acid ABC transporter permease [Propionibacteriaceae bacterium]
MGSLEWLLNWGNGEQLLKGIGYTLLIALISSALSIVLGIGFGFVLASKNRWLRGFGRGYLEFVRIAPIVVLLYLLYYFASAELGWNITNVTTAIVIFTLWGAGEFGDIVRGALSSIPAHQYESGRTLGLSNAQLYRLVIIPQSVRRITPAAINLITRMIKTTSLCSFISVAETMTIGRQIISVANQSFHHPEAPLVVYSVVMVAYFLMCWPLAKAARKLESSWG